MILPPKFGHVYDLKKEEIFSREPVKTMVQPQNIYIQRHMNTEKCI